MDSNTFNRLTEDQRAAMHAFEDGHDQHPGYIAFGLGAECSGSGHDAVRIEYSPDSTNVVRSWADPIPGPGPEPVCTCECLRPATHLEPAEWQQDPDCPVHPMAAAQDLDEGPTDGCAQGTVDPWVDRTELLRIAAGKASNQGEVIPLAARMEAFVLTGSDLGKALPNSSAREVLAQGLAATGRLEGDGREAAIAQELEGWLEVEGYALVRTSGVQF